MDNLIVKRYICRPNRIYPLPYLPITGMTDIGNNIRNIRELKNLKRSYVAGKLGLTVSALGRIERGESEISLSRLTEIAEILEVQIEDIMTFNPNEVLKRHLPKTSDKTNHKPIQSGLNNFAEMEALKKENEYLRSVLERLLLNRD